MNRRNFLKSALVGTAAATVPVFVTATSFKVRPVYAREPVSFIEGDELQRALARKFLESFEHNRVLTKMVDKRMRLTGSATDTITFKRPETYASR